MAPRKQRVNDKVESSEDKVKNLSLFFLQGKEMRLSGLGDVEKLKVDIITQQEGEDKKHVSVPLEKADDGSYKLTVPDLYKRDGSDKYLVCDTIFYVDSFTKNDHIAWETFSEEQKLDENFAKQNDIRLKMRSVVPSDGEIDSLRAEIPGLVKVRDELVKKQNAAFGDMTMGDEEVLRITARVKLANARLKEAQTQLHVWEDESKPLEIAEKTAPYSKELRMLEEEVNRIFLTFAHGFASREGMTTESLEEWFERADEQDHSNAITWVAEGNARKMLGRIAKPLTQEEERAREMARLLN